MSAARIMPPEGAVDTASMTGTSAARLLEGRLCGVGQLGLCNVGEDIAHEATRHDASAVWRVGYACARWHPGGPSCEPCRDAPPLSLPRDMPDGGSFAEANPPQVSAEILHPGRPSPAAHPPRRRGRRILHDTMTPPPADPIQEASTAAAAPVRPREKEKKTRSRSGCYTCRRRKVRFPSYPSRASG